MKIIVHSVIFGIFFGMIIFLGLVEANNDPIFKYSLLETDANTIKEISVRDERFSIYEIRNIALEVANSKEYELHVYDCTDFSKELVKRLTKKGYKAQCTAGHTPNWDYKDHTWVSVFIGTERFEIESTGGYIIDPSTYKEDYEKMWEGFCW